MSQKLPVGGSKQVKKTSMIDENFIKNYDEDSNIGYFLDVDVECPKELHDVHIDLPFLPEKMKNNKWNKFVCNLYDKKNYFIHIRTLKQALMHGLKLKRFTKYFSLIKKHDLNHILI